MTCIHYAFNAGVALESRMKGLTNERIQRDLPKRGVWKGRHYSEYDYATITVTLQRIRLRYDYDYGRYDCDYDHHYNSCDYGYDI